MSSGYSRSANWDGSPQRGGHSRHNSPQHNVNQNANGQDSTHPAPFSTFVQSGNKQASGDRVSVPKTQPHGQGQNIVVAEPVESNHAAAAHPSTSNVQNNQSAGGQTPSQVV